MALTFERATKRRAKLRMALLGPAGSGKTYSALKIARALVGDDTKVALMDTEHGSASKYAGLFEFDTVEPEEFSVDTYLEVIHNASELGYAALIIDSLSHAWAGKGGLLEFVDNQAKRGNGNSFGAWRDATPKHNQLVEAMLGARCHVIATMRVKTEYVQEKDDRGKTTIRKVGLQPVQRDGLEYEFDVVGDLTAENELIVTKTRCPDLRGGIFANPGENVAAPLRAWLDGAEPLPPRDPTSPTLGAEERRTERPRPVSMNDYRKLVDECLPLGIVAPPLPDNLKPSDLAARHAHLSAKKHYVESAAEAKARHDIDAPALPEKCTRAKILEMQQYLDERIRLATAPAEPEEYDGEVPEDQEL